MRHRWIAAAGVTSLLIGQPMAAGDVLAEGVLAEDAVVESVVAESVVAESVASAAVSSAALSDVPATRKPPRIRFEEIGEQAGVRIVHS